MPTCSTEISVIELDCLMKLLSLHQQGVARRQLARAEVAGVVVYGDGPENKDLLVTPFGPGCANKDLPAFEGSCITVAGTKKFPVFAHTKIIS